MPSLADKHPQRITLIPLHRTASMNEWLIGRMGKVQRAHLSIPQAMGTLRFAHPTNSSVLTNCKPPNENISPVLNNATYPVRGVCYCFANLN